MCILVLGLLGWIHEGICVWKGRGGNRNNATKNRSSMILLGNQNKKYHHTYGREYTYDSTIDLKIMDEL